MPGEVVSAGRRLAAAGAAAILLASVAGSCPAGARPAAHLYANCTHFNHKYPHGVGKRHAHDHTSGTPVTDFKRSNKIYNRAMSHNSDLDRDKDHIACEKA